MALLPLTFTTRVFFQSSSFRDRQMPSGRKESHSDEDERAEAVSNQTQEGECTLAKNGAHRKGYVTNLSLAPQTDFSGPQELSHGRSVFSADGNVHKRWSKATGHLHPFPQGGSSSVLRRCAGGNKKCRGKRDARLWLPWVPQI